MAQTLSKAKTLDEAIRTAGWQIFEAVSSLADHRKSAAQAIKTRIAEILSSDEHAIALKPALDEQQAKALRLLTDVAQPPEPPPPGPVTPPKAEPGAIVVRESESVDLDPKQARKVLGEIGQELEKDSGLRLSITWRLVKPGNKS